ncbi:MAG TPA: S53 family peptidase [Rhodanobacteraceae bacterium]|nr:S53 family peptidase [Rhodanobacteraceae bacterium]
MSAAFRTKAIAVVLVAFVSHDALAAVANRVVAPVDPDDRVTLAGRRAGWISPANDEGRVPDDVPLASLSVVLKRAPERQRAFEQLLADQQDPASPDFHRWLTPSAIGERFGATPHDIAAITDWLTAAGLHVDSVSNTRTRIRFSGSAHDVGMAFATSFRYYRAGGSKRIAAASNAAIPAALADVVSSVAGLDAIRFAPALRVSAPRRAAAGPIAPAETYCPGGGQPCHHSIFPADFATIFDLYPIYDEHIRGAGQKVAIVGRERVYQADNDNFSRMAELDVETPTTIVPTGGVDPGDPLSTCPDPADPDCGNPKDQVGGQAEATLDVQRVMGVAPEAAIALIVSANTNTDDGVNLSIEYAVDHEPVPAKILSISFGSCEADNGRAVAESMDDFFSQAAAEGITVLVSSGDAGVAGCASLDAAPAAGEPESINIFCASQYVTCIGGTEFADKANPDLYWYPSSNAENFGSAIGYIPEGSWNEPLDSDGNPQLAASGGGVSLYLPTPSWQTGPGVPGTQGRYTPDVSLPAATREGYFTCLAAKRGPCTRDDEGFFSFFAFGGTSAGAPSFAGIVALLNQKTGSAQGNLNPRLYALARAGSNAFHDVTVASSGVSGCTASVPSLCNNSTPGVDGLTGGLAGYLVGNGYDLATGLGSVDAANFLAAWNASAPAVNLDQAGLSGSWYNPSTGGQGIVMQVVPDLYGAGEGLLFGGWFTFDATAAGGQRWYSVQGTVSAASASATMPIYISEGGNFDAPPAVGVTPVGEATFAFADCTHGTLSYVFTDGSQRNGEIPLARLGANVACTPSGDDAGSGSYLLSGTWYDTATGGQGFLFDINPVQRSVFIAWYTYATDGEATGGGASQRWYTLQGGYTPGRATIDDIPIYATTGGVFDDPHAVTTSAVGTASLDFHSCSATTLSYRFTSGENAGRSGTIALSRTTQAPASCGL